MNNWIKVDDRLPTQGTVVMAYNDVKSEDHRIMVVWYDAKYKKFRDWEDESGISERDYDSFFNAITHWQPLPEAPNKKRAGNQEDSVLSPIKSRKNDELMSEKEYQGCGMYEDLDGSQLL